MMRTDRSLLALPLICLYFVVCCVFCSRVPDRPRKKSSTCTGNISYVPSIHQIHSQSNPCNSFN